MRSAQPIMLKKTISQLLNKAEPQVRHELQILLAHALDRNQTFVLAHPEYQVGWLTQFAFYWSVIKRAYGIPLAYILKHKEFFGLDFLVNKHTLIPRPETELLVEIAMTKIHEQLIADCEQKICLIDVGTGTGCIPISITANISSKNLEVHAIDISKSALKVATLNAKKYRAPIQFHQGHLLNPVIRSVTTTNSLIITANLPYLTRDEFYLEPSIQHEPQSALIAETGGLALYFELINQLATRAQNQNKQKISLLCEINPPQVTPLKTAILSAFPTASIQVHSDLAGLDRIVHASWIQ